MIHKDEISMNVVQNKPYLINKCCNYIKYSIDNYNIYFYYSF